MKSERLNRVKCLSEDAYELQMEQRVEPFLYEIRQTGSLVVDGDSRHALYYELYPREAARGTIVISYGFTESCLKYRELIYYFWQQGYQVAIMDHRGHGKSFRQVEDGTIVYVERFSLYVKDLHLFVHKIVKPMADNKPLYLYGHSMGGGIAIFYLEQYPKDFDRAVLNAPMLGLEMGVLPGWIARSFCDIKVLTGKGKERLISHTAFDPEENFEKSSADSRARFAYYHKLRCADESYQTSSASYYWGREAINASTFILSRNQVKKICVPVLLFTAGNETLVNVKNHKLFIDRVANGRQVVVPDTKHEIYRAGNDVLQRYLEEIFDFLEDKETAEETEC